MKLNLLISCIVVVCGVAHSWYQQDDELVDLISRRVVDIMEEEMKIPLVYLHTLKMEKEAKLGDGSRFFLTFEVASPIDGNKICDAVYVEDTKSVPYYECYEPEEIDEPEEGIDDSDPFVYERDDIPLDDGEADDDDDSQYDDCSSEDRASLLREIVHDLNKQVDETNDEFDMPDPLGMDMGNFKQGHFEGASISSCKKMEVQDGMKYKVEMKAKQDHVKETCQIILVGKINALKITKNQCQGQN
ncbi:uncharacterized protein LOC120336429 [Styela clava]